ncbi:MAG: pyridoxamine 5'-phosphate oxidase family protein [Methylobacter sp.]|uniref:HugZ family pyridoxamine 5'-phosphate oxidase n=1 Tax=Methylobacter sp. TaxID=2051955 RepID=UPI0027322898|nr:pyridoxamine 5'-phosphate oxidase family protein [Methylobacter sp.]MDP1666156.1 pyridoxamine 5'-phosphate oxidase family protein [Methylobacter sp.]
MGMFKMNNTDNNLSDKTTSLQELLASQQTILLSTASGNSVPDLSVAPFVRDQAGCFYIFISELAMHTANLLNNPQASVMFIRTESESNNLFARERAVFNCKARKIERSEPLYTIQLKALQDKFGEVVSLLQTLTDFHLFSLCPESGRYIMGFGQAYMINIKEGKVSPLNKNSS